MTARGKHKKSEKQPRTAEEQFQLETRCRLVTDVYKVSRDVTTAWFEAARSGDLRTLRQLYKSVVGGTADPSSAPPLVHVNGEGTSYAFVGHTALHWAAATGDVPMMTQLLEWGAAPNAQNKGGSTPLHSACANLRVDSVSLLLQHGANPDVTDCLNETPIDTLRQFARGGSASQSMARGSLRKLVTEIESLLQMQSLARSMLNNNNNSSSVSVASMQRLLVGCGMFPSAEECPKEKADLVRATQTALEAFRAKLHAAGSSDASFEKLRGEFEQRLFAHAAEKDRRQSEKSADAAASAASSAVGSAERAAEEEEEAEEGKLLAEKAKQCSAKGNAAFGSGDWRAAVQHYTTAISLCPTDATFYSNRAAAYLKMKAPKKALADAQNAAALKPDWAKPYHRWGCAAFDLGQLNDAVAAFKMGLERAPDDATLLAGMEQVNAVLRERRGAAAPIDGERAPAATAATAQVRKTASAIDKSLQELQSVLAREAPAAVAAPTSRRRVVTSSSSDDDEESSKKGAGGDAGGGGFYWHGDTLVRKGYQPPKHDWFDCVLCENKTRDAAKSPCCDKLICGTCLKRRFGPGKPCPFKCC